MARRSVTEAPPTISTSPRTAVAGSTSALRPAAVRDAGSRSTAADSTPAIARWRTASRSTTVARTLLDLAAIVDRRRVERALERAEKLELFDLRQIEAACERAPGHHGLKALNQALALYMPDNRTRSELERDLLDLCRNHDLPLPEVNALVDGYEVDALWPDARLIVEVDSWEHHRDRAAFERDRVRDADLKLAGYTVIRITARRLADQPEQVAALIRRAISRVRTGRPAG